MVIDQNNSTFSDIPALDDTAGMQKFLEDASMREAGINPGAAQPAASPEQQTQAQPVQGGTPNPAQGQPVNYVTKEDLDKINARLDSIIAGNRINANPQQPIANVYTPQEQAFISQALAQGYSLSQIQSVIMQKRGGGNSVNDARLAAVEQAIRQQQQQMARQQYEQEQNAFIERVSSFGEKFGLSEQDIVTFATVANQKGINIALPNVDLEAVFRAVYPQQYAVRMKRMQSTPSSQIYGGSNVPEASRAQASRMEDAYVESFLQQAMPNQYFKKQ